MSEKKGLLRRLYDWVLSWAERPFGTWALFLISFAESSIFPVPPDPLLLALCMGRRDRSLFFGLVATLGSVLGGLFGYFLGWALWDQLQGFFFDWIPGFNEAKFGKIQGNYEEHGVLIVFLAGFSPIPYKIFTIASGVFGLNIFGFAAASIIGRGARFFLVAELARRYGQPVRAFIEKRFNLMALLFGILLVGGFVTAKMLL